MKEKGNDCRIWAGESGRKRKAILKGIARTRFFWLETGTSGKLL
jgi:hypothetical protein